jgi:hypothetical protein
MSIIKLKTDVKPTEQTINDPLNIAFIGSVKPNITLYLPNPPEVQSSFMPTAPDIVQLIEDNGNHWRKILTIFAKLACASDSAEAKHWKSYRDNKLLQQREKICFEDVLSLADDADDGWHLVAGKASWQRLGFDCEQFTPLDPQGRAFYQQRVILTPYPDYRQFPNALIEQVVSVMTNSTFLAP